jgi:hypothetical protein
LTLITGMGSERWRECFARNSDVCKIRLTGTEFSRKNLKNKEDVPLYRKIWAYQFPMKSYVGKNVGILGYVGKNVGNSVGIFS